NLLEQVIRLADDEVRIGRERDAAALRFDALAAARICRGAERPAGAVVEACRHAVAGVEPFDELTVLPILPLLVDDPGAVDRCIDPIEIEFQQLAIADRIEPGHAVAEALHGY